MLRSFFDNLNFSFNTVGYRLTRNVEVVGSNPIKGPLFSPFPLLLNTGWFQEGSERDFTIELT